MAPFANTEERSYIADFSNFVISSDFTVVYEKPSETTDIFGFIKPFDATVSFLQAPKEEWVNFQTTKARVERYVIVQFTSMVFGVNSLFLGGLHIINLYISVLYIDVEIIW